MIWGIYKWQIKENVPKKAFEKVRLVYGDRMEDAPGNYSDRQGAIENLDELLSMRRASDKKHYNLAGRAAFFIGLIIVTLGIVYLIVP